MNGMRRTLKKHGNGWALVIERPVMELLGITPETAAERLLDLRIEGGSLIVTPVREKGRSWGKRGRFMMEVIKYGVQASAQAMNLEGHEVEAMLEDHGPVPDLVQIAAFARRFQVKLSVFLEDSEEFEGGGK